MQHDLIDIGMFRAIHRKMELRHITYCWGGDGSDWTRQVGDMDCLDCSLFSRIIIGKCTQGAIVLPRTSDKQHQWAIAQGFPRYQYNRPTMQEHYGSLLMCFIRPVAGEHAGHVWYINQGATYECCGSAGVTSRPWYTRILVEEADSAFLLVKPNGN